MNWEDIKPGMRVRFLLPKPLDDTTGASTIVGFSGLVIEANEDYAGVSGIGRIYRNPDYELEQIDDDLKMWQDKMNKVLDDLGPLEPGI